MAGRYSDQAKARVEALRMRYEGGAVGLEDVLGDMTVRWAKLIPRNDGFLVRMGFISCAGVVGTVSDRRLPARIDRPPAAQLASVGKSDGLRVELALLALAQTKPHTRLPVVAEDNRTGLVDLVLARRRTNSQGEMVISQRDRAARSIANTLDLLCDVGLVSLPNVSAAKGKREAYQLLDESGPEAGLRINNRLYQRPRTANFRVPQALLANNWNHLLTPRQLLMLVFALGVAGDGQARAVTSDERLRKYGVGRDTFLEARFLEALGLLEVHLDENRWASGQSASGEPQMPNRILAIPEALESDGLTVFKGLAA